MNSTAVHPFRIYTLQIDGATHVKAFSHPEAVAGTALDRHLHEKFAAWLHGAMANRKQAGYIAKIAFTDRLRRKYSFGPMPIHDRKDSPVVDTQRHSPTTQE